MAATRTITRQEEKAARVASVKCKGCGAKLGEGLKLYSVGDGTYECEQALANGKCGQA